MTGASARIRIGPAGENDIEWLFRYDPHIPKRLMREKVARGEVVVARRAGTAVGLLRYSLFCDWVPFIIFLFVPQRERGRGVGSRLVAFFERRMRRQRRRIAMVSSGARRQAQHFWRTLGYRDAGCLAIPGEPFELLFTKEL